MIYPTGLIVNSLWYLDESHSEGNNKEMRSLPMADRVMLDDKLRKFLKKSSAVRAEKEPHKFDLKEGGRNNEPIPKGDTAGEFTTESVSSNMAI